MTVSAFTAAAAVIVMPAAGSVSGQSQFACDDAAGQIIACADAAVPEGGVCLRDRVPPKCSPH